MAEAKDAVASGSGGTSRRNESEKSVVKSMKLLLKDRKAPGPLPPESSSSLDPYPPIVGVVLDDYDDKESYFIDVQKNLKSYSTSEPSNDPALDNSRHGKFDFVALRLLTDEKVARYEELLKSDNPLYPDSTELTRWSGGLKCMTILNLSGVPVENRKDPGNFSPKVLKCIIDQVAMTEHLSTRIIFDLDCIPPIVIAPILCKHILHDIEDRESAKHAEYVNVVAAIVDIAELQETEKNVFVVGEDPWRRWNQIQVLCKHSHSLGVMLRLPYLKLLELFEATGDLTRSPVVRRWMSEQIIGIMIEPDGLEAENNFESSFTQLIDGFLTNNCKILIKPGKCRASEAKILGIIDAALIRKRKNIAVPVENYSVRKFRKDCRPLNYPMYSKDMRDFCDSDVKLHQKYELAVATIIFDHFSHLEELVLLLPNARDWNFVNAVRKGILTSWCKGIVRVYVLQEDIGTLETFRAKESSPKFYQDGFKNIIMEWVSSSAAEWKEQVQVDLIVSKAMGSFGCDMMLPEIIQSSMKFLKPEGLVVPQHLKCYLVPVMTPSLFKFFPLRERVLNHILSLPETPMKCNLDRAFHLDVEKVAFEYHFNRQMHTNKATHSKSSHMEFKSCFKATLYGFAGYFDAQLSPDGVTVSSRPSMRPEEEQEISQVSWLPAYFPLRNYLNVREGQRVHYTFTRCTDPKKMWYQWCLTSPTSQFHNLGGLFYSVLRTDAERSIMC